MLILLIALPSVIDDRVVAADGAAVVNSGIAATCAQKQLLGWVWKEGVPYEDIELGI